MALETGTYISDLVVTNPANSDPKSQGDDHLRLAKTAMVNTLLGFSGTIIATGTDGGAANAYTLTPSRALPAYSTKMLVIFAPTAANTGACTLNISGLGAKALLSVSGAALVAGDLAVGTIYSAIYDGTQFLLTSITKNYADQLAFTSSLPAQAGNADKFIKTDGTAASWATIFFQAAAVAADIKTGTDTAKTVTSASVLGALGFSAYMQTADQAITSGGALTIAHGLGRTPILMLGFLKNISAQGNYVTGDIIPHVLGATQILSNFGVSVTADATNLYVRYGSQAVNTMVAIDKTTGASFNPTNTSWSFFLRVLA